MFKFQWDALTEEDEKRAQDFLNESFRNVKKPDFIGDIEVTDLSFGDEPPIVQLEDISPVTEDVKACIVHEIKEFSDDDLQIQVRLVYKGNARFSIQTELVINWPSPGFGRLPIVLHITQCAFEGMLVGAHPLFSALPCYT
jgi:distribution and morphology protein 12